MSIKHVHSTIADTLFLMKPVLAGTMQSAGFHLRLIPGYIYDLPRVLTCPPDNTRIIPDCDILQWSAAQRDSMFFREIMGGTVCMSEGFHVTFDYASNSISVADSSEECTIFIPYTRSDRPMEFKSFDFAIATDSNGRCIRFAESVQIGRQRLDLLLPMETFPVSSSKDVAILQTNGMGEVLFVHRASYENGSLSTSDVADVYHGQIVTGIKNPYFTPEKEPEMSTTPKSARAAIGAISNRISGNVAADLKRCAAHDNVLQEQVMKALTTLCDIKTAPARIEHEGFGDNRRSTAHYNGFKVPMGPENELRIRFVEGTVGNKGPDTIDMVHRMVREFFELDLTYNKDQLKVDVWANGSLVIDIILKKD